MREGANLRYIVSTFVNVTIYPRYSNNIIKKFKFFLKCTNEKRGLEAWLKW
jgi:hypothetical protein